MSEQAATTSEPAAAGTAAGADAAVAAATATATATEGAATQVATEAQPAAAAPVDYKVTLPEGVKFSDATVAQYTDRAKKNGLTAEQAQDMLGYMAEAKTGFDTGMADTVKNTQAQWLADTKADKEIGGTNYDQTMGHVAKALDTYSSPEMKSFLEDTGLRNQPDFVRMMSKIGKDLGNDTIVTGPAGGTSTLSIADRMYKSTSQGAK